LFDFFNFYALAASLITFLRIMAFTVSGDMDNEASSPQDATILWHICTQFAGPVEGLARTLVLRELCPC